MIGIWNADTAFLLGGAHFHFKCMFSWLWFIFQDLKRFIALYDYTAADDDEVSFAENDILCDATIIDEGWLEGRVESTGQYGMAPRNYFEEP